MKKQKIPRRRKGTPTVLITGRIAPPIAEALSFKALQMGISKSAALEMMIAYYMFSHQAQEKEK